LRWVEVLPRRCDCPRARSGKQKAPRRLSGQYPRRLYPYNVFGRLDPHRLYTRDEAIDFIDLSDQIARHFARDQHGKGGGSLSAGVKALLMKRARIVASAVNKLEALKATLGGRRPETHSLYYCGDGWVNYGDDDDDDDDDDAGLSGRQVEVVSQLLDGLGWKVCRFTAREGRREREEILRNFRLGLIDAMVAIKCLDEGIDVPACRTAYFLASSRDPRQFIQRRGRILRRSPGKTIATIYDYIAVLPDDAHDESGAARNLIRSELERVAEFSSLAANNYAAYETLRPVLISYDLEHVL
jgi:hypothetical protein